MLNLAIFKSACYQPVTAITMLGSNVRLRWKQESDALVVKKPSDLPEWQVIGFRIEIKD